MTSFDLAQFCQLDGRPEFDFLKNFPEGGVCHLVASIADHRKNATEPGFRKSAGQQSVPQLIQMIEQIFTMLDRPSLFFQRVRDLLHGQ